MIPVIKICGITSLADAEAAISGGASYIGLIFAEASPRKVDRSKAIAIVEAIKGRVKTVGVFKDTPPRTIEDTYESIGLDLVQYHGGESPELIKSLALPAFKAFELDESFRWETVRSFEGLLEKILLDRPKSGAAPDWLARAIETAASAPTDIPPFFFAGGLTGENVRSLIRTLKNARFHGVDVASGVEKEPGVKDHSKIESFCKAVREEAMTCER